MDVKHIPIRNVDEAELIRISREGLLSLNHPEMKAIQSYFARQGREPTDVEIETIAQTWSEHCIHKTFKSRIEYAENGGTVEIIDGLFNSFIRRATEEINKDWCVSVFVDNAGIIEFDDDYNITFKVETHNHPSAIEPYGGAGTGIGGVIRDSLGTGLGAKPILNTDVFCFGPLDLAYNQLPTGSLHPRRVFKGVVAGVRDYGNRMGIPTANGAILFDSRFTGNPLVFCGNVGLIPRDRCEKSVHPGDLILAVGGRTGRDGIHGATFSSLELDDASESLGSVVQIGNPDYGEEDCRRSDGGSRPGTLSIDYRLRRRRILISCRRDGKRHRSRGSPRKRAVEIRRTRSVGNLAFGSTRTDGVGTAPGERCSNDGVVRS